VLVPGGAELSRSLLVDGDPVLVAAPGFLAVPVVSVPGLVGTLAELPAPLGSLPELFRPPALAGPDGVPLTDWEPAPAAPALGVPAALGLPAEGPLAAPPALAPLAPPPLPPPPPPPPWAKDSEDDPKVIMTTSMRAWDFIGRFPPKTDQDSKGGFVPKLARGHLLTSRRDMQ
jgi:hypothetical protein